MARYIDADKLVAWCRETFQVQSTVAGKAYIDAFLTAILSCHTADVVPRAEVAREIFKDLWEMVIPEKCTDGCSYYLDMAEELTELEKKYTEARNEHLR